MIDFFSDQTNADHLARISRDLKELAHDLGSVSGSSRMSESDFDAIRRELHKLETSAAILSRLSASVSQWEERQEKTGNKPLLPF
jgi:DNA-binding transcriptional regulator YiaG